MKNVKDNIFTLAYLDGNNDDEPSFCIVQLDDHEFKIESFINFKEPVCNYESMEFDKLEYFTTMIPDWYKRSKLFLNDHILFIIFI